ncbi:putative toxin-antitoxin system toxin component, PIN family [Candidatus Woesearchaeota archaeon]|nr:putative toxin-antitoxin system toxin component, PIN family [Candidatus Woesearchaeota archaeon]
MLKFTLDTNTLISATISQGNEYELLRLAHQGKIKLVLSMEIIKEFEEVLLRPKFGYTNEQVDNAVKQVLNICEIVVPTHRLHVIVVDPDDNRILECAVTGYVDYIVSGDKHLLHLKKYSYIPIIRTFEALQIIKRSKQVL